MSPSKGPKMLKIINGILIVLTLRKCLASNGHQEDKDLTSEVRSPTYQINKLDEIQLGEGIWIWHLEFDKDLNTYITGENDLYIFNGQNEMQSHIVFTDSYDIHGFRVNSKGEIYVFMALEGNIDSLWLIKDKSSPAIKLYELRKENYRTKFFMDFSDNIYLNTERGVVFLRRNQNVLLRIRHLENFHFNVIEEDAHGNVYLLGSEKGKDCVYLVTNDVKKKSLVPYATIVSNITNEVSAFKFWHYMVLFVENREDEEISTVKTLLPEPKDFLMSQYRVQYSFLDVPTTSSRFFIFEQNNDYSLKNNLYFIDHAMNVVHVNETVLKQSIDSYVVGKQGTAYFFLTEPTPKILLLESDQIKFQENDIFLPLKFNIYDLAIDGNDNLWILSNELYLLEKGKDTLLKISQNNELETHRLSYFKIKPRTNEVYIISGDKVFFLSTKINGSSNDTTKEAL